MYSVYWAGLHGTKFSIYRSITIITIYIYCSTAVSSTCHISAQVTSIMAESITDPRIVIEYCTQCRWMLRAAWYAQELLTTFQGQIGEVALKPSSGGNFFVTLYSKGESKLLWNRKERNGFPGMPYIAQLRHLVISLATLYVIRIYKVPRGFARSSGRYDPLTKCMRFGQTERSANRLL